MNLPQAQALKVFAASVLVTFTAPTTGASGTFAGKGGSTATATSDVNGLATSPTFTANAVVGIYTVTASASGILTPASFDLTNTTGAPATITATAGSNQSAPVDGAFTNPFEVTVVDSGNNPVSDAMVVFTAPATGASGVFTNGSNVTTALTNASGVAISTAFTANGVAGPDNVVASVAGTSSSASFDLTNLAGPPSTITASAGTPQSVIANKLFGATLSALVVDSLQNPVVGAVVTVQDKTISSGTYSIADTGYGTLTIPSGILGDVSAFGLYMTDPNLNLLHPNNKTSGVGGALLLDLDTTLAGGTGVVIPQTDTASADFTGSYAFGGQDQNFLLGSEGEFDFVGMATVTSGALAGSASLSDPFLTLGGAAKDSAVTFSSTPLPDPSNAGRFTMLSANSPANPLKVKVKNVAQQLFNVVMYQASGDQFLWLDEDATSVFLGSLQQWGSFTTLP